MLSNFPLSSFAVTLNIESMTLVMSDQMSHEREGCSGTYYVLGEQPSVASAKGAWGRTHKVLVRGGRRCSRHKCMDFHLT